MAVVTTWKKNFNARPYRGVLMKMSYGNGDTSIAAVTGLKIIYSVTHSCPSVNTKTVTDCDVSGGTVTLTVADPLGSAYLFITAIGI
jgi:hypothetical protein